MKNFVSYLKLVKTNTSFPCTPLQPELKTILISKNSKKMLFLTIESRYFVSFDEIWLYNNFTTTTPPSCINPIWAKETHFEGYNKKSPIYIFFPLVILIRPLRATIKLLLCKKIGFFGKKILS